MGTTFIHKFLLRCLQTCENHVARVNKADGQHVNLLAKSIVEWALNMAQEHDFTMDVDGIIDSLVSPEEIAYLQSLGEFVCRVFFFFASLKRRLTWSIAVKEWPVPTKSRHGSAVDFAVIIDFGAWIGSNVTNKCIFLLPCRSR